MTFLYNQDYNEVNTVAIIQDICANVLGYQKYLELEVEYPISEKRCDMAIFIDKKRKCLIEVKAIRLNNIHIEKFVLQAVQYGIDIDINCVVLTNARIWYVYWINFEDPKVVPKCLFKFDILDSRTTIIVRCFQYLAKEHITHFIEDQIAVDKLNATKKRTSYNKSPKILRFCRKLCSGVKFVMILHAILLDIKKSISQSKKDL
ncbi:MAG: hypothetical protein OXC44_03510 [Proteobacteria bacterium]|nr:hypothetical protein [Pseudomonadota bacterium]